MKQYSILLLLQWLTIIFLFVQLISSVPITQPLTGPENLCIKNLLTKSSMLNSLPFSDYLDTDTGDYDLCLYFGCYNEFFEGETTYYLSLFELIYVGGGIPSYELFYGDLNCFDRLNTLKLEGFKLSGNFILGTDSLRGLAKHVTFNKCYNVYFPTIISTKTESLTLGLVETMLGTVRSSSFKTLKSLKITQESSAAPVRIINDYYQPIQMDYLEIFTDQVPTLTGINIKLFYLFLDSLYFATTSNFATFNSIDTLEIEALSDQIGFPLNLFASTNNIGNIVLNSRFIAPTSKIDISTATNLKSFTFTLKPSTGPFVYPPTGNNQFPFIFPSLERLNYKSPVAELNDFSTFSNIKWLNLDLNGILGIFPSKQTLPLIKQFSINNNQMGGSISDEWCNTILDISYNAFMNGPVPMCFDCYYDHQQIISDYFYGTNLIRSFGCNLLAMPGITFNTDGNFEVYGYNLGYLPPKSHPEIATDVITPNQLFKGFWDVSSKGAIPFSFQFEFMGQNFTLVTTPDVPSFSTDIVSTLDTETITHTFEGNFFSYIPQEIEIMIEEIQCNVIASTIGAVTCTIPLNSNHPPGYLLVYFKVKDLTTQLIVSDVAGTSGTVYTQVNLCDPWCKNGYCMTNTLPATCNCGGQYLGDDCSITPQSCLNNCIDSSHGTCNPLTGLCQCGPDWKGNDCSLPFVPCYYSCSNGGRCNDNIGECICLYPYYDVDCQFMYCLNNCTSALNGVCDRDTGICGCLPDFQSDDCSLPYIPCTVTCVAGQGVCNDQIGKCECSADFQGEDCSRPYKACPVATNSLECNVITGVNLNSCNNETGVCTCDSAHQSLNCGIPFKECLNNCNGIQGHCFNQTGVCTCIADYTSIDCSLPSQYISSISSTTTAGGLVSITGWFGSIHTGLSIVIGTLECNVQSINASFISCIAEPGFGTQTVSVTQNGIIWMGKDIYHYEEITYSCPNDCSSNGNCNTKVGQCKCFSGYGGFDCNAIKNDVISSTSTTTTAPTSTPTPTTTTNTEPPESTPEPIIIPPTITKVNPIVGSAIINNQQTSYEILISSLVEINFDGTPIVSHSLQRQWNTMTTENNIYQFYQTIKNTNCTITYSIEELKQSRDYEFAGLELTLDQDSIKISVKILNYPYLNSLNTLQLQMQSKIGIVESSDENGGECNDQETTIVDTDKLDKNKLLNYITIEKNKKVLYGRFINRVVSDSHPTFITTTVIPNLENTGNISDIITIGLNLPHFKESVTIDPDFSLLVASTYKSKCDNGVESNNRSWVLPVAIVIPCVVVVALAIVGAIIFRKHRTKILLAKGSFSFSLKNLSRKHRESLYMPNN